MTKENLLEWGLTEEQANIPVPVNRVFSPTIKKSCLNPSGGGPDGKMGPV